MKVLVKIISGDDRYSMRHSDLLKKRLDELSMNSEIRSLISENEPTDMYNGASFSVEGSYADKFFATILKEDADVAVVPLNKVPEVLPEGLVICGLSEREDPSVSLLIKSSNYNQSANLSVLEGSKVGVTSEISGLQLINLNPKIHTQIIRDNLKISKELMDSGHLDAVLFSTCELSQLDFDSNYFSLKSLHPREFIPSCGQGVVAYICHEEDLDTRKVIKKIHHVKTSDCTNVERTMLKLVELQSNLVSVYCENDNKGYYHAFVVMADQNNDGLKRGRVSQSTTLGLAENLYNSIY